MRRISVEDIVFWIIIIFLIATLLWMLYGSPTLEGFLISVVAGLISSEIMLWRTIFNMDKRTTIGFIKIKNDMDKNNLIINNKLDNRFNKLEDKLNLITNKVKGGKSKQKIKWQK